MFIVVEYSYCVHDVYKWLLLLLLVYVFMFFFLYFAILTFQAQIEQWIDFASLEINVNIFVWYSPRVGRAPYLPPVSCLQRIFNIKEVCNLEKNFDLIYHARCELGSLVLLVKL